MKIFLLMHFFVYGGLSAIHGLILMRLKNQKPARILALFTKLRIVINGAPAPETCRVTTPDFFAQMPVTGPTTPRVVRPFGIFGLIPAFAGVLILGGVFLALGAALWIGLAGYLGMDHGFNTLALQDINAIKHAPHSVQMMFYGILAATFVAFGLAALAMAFVCGGRQWRVHVAWTDAAGWPSGRGLWLLIGLALVYPFALGAGVQHFFPNFQTWVFIPRGVTGVILSFVTVVLLAPWAEELVFRGWIYSSLRRSLGVWTAVAATTLLFAVAHMDPTGLYPLLIFIPGLVLTIVREMNNSAKASFLAHALYNGMIWLILFFFGNPWEGPVKAAGIG